jgi:hypothetical protein
MILAMENRESKELTTGHEGAARLEALAATPRRKFWLTYKEYLTFTVGPFLIWITVLLMLWPVESAGGFLRVLIGLLPVYLLSYAFWVGSRLDKLVKQRRNALARYRNKDE